MGGKKLTVLALTKILSYCYNKSLYISKFRMNFQKYLHSIHNENDVFSSKRIKGFHQELYLSVTWCGESVEAYKDRNSIYSYAGYLITGRDKLNKSSTITESFTV